MAQGDINGNGRVELSGGKDAQGVVLLSSGGRLQAITSDGHAEISIHDPVSPNRRIATAEFVPVTQVDFTYGTPTAAFVSQRLGGTGSITGARGYSTVATGGTAAGAFASLYSARSARVRDGQGIEAIFIARFGDTSHANSIRMVGPFTPEDGFGVGYYGTSLATHVKSGGIREIRTLTVSVGAGGAENVTVKLNGVDTVVAVTSGSTSNTAWQLASATYSGWRAYSVGATVVFVADSVGALAGAFSLTSTGTATGTFATTVTGAAGSDTWTTQANWSEDPLDGTGPSGLVVDFTEWQTFRFLFTDTTCAWFIKDKGEGTFVPFHRANSAGSVFLTNSTVSLQVIAYNQGTTSASTSVDIAGISAFSCGPLRRIGARRARTTAVTGLTTTNTPIASYRLRPFYGTPSRQFSGEVYIPQVQVANDGNRALVLDISVAASLVAPVWADVAGAAGSSVQEDVSGTFSGGTIGGTTIFSIVVASKTTAVVDLAAFDLLLLRDQVLTFSARALSTTTDILLSVPWIEER